MDENGNQNVAGGIPLVTNDGGGLISFVNSRFGGGNPTTTFPTILTVGTFPCSGQAEACFGAGTFEFAATNNPPAAIDDDFDTNEDIPLNVVLPGVLDNDEDVDGDTLTAVLGDNVANGTLDLNADGSFTYTPNANFHGTDSFTYFANDGTVNSDAAATVTITVNAVNDAPVANNDNFETNEDIELTVPATGVLGNDVDVDGDMLTAVLETGPSNGVLTLNPDGSFTYTPNANFNGTDSFTYFANDGTVDSDTAATVMITVNPVNDAPVANNDDITTTVDTPVTIDVLANDTDVDTGDTANLMIESVVQPLNGEVVNNGTDVTYTPNAGFIGTDTFDYNVTDTGGLTDTATVTVTVVPVLTALYHMDKTATSGTTLLPPIIVTTPDDSGSELDATLIGDARIVKRGKFDRALSLDGMGDYAETAADREANFDLRRFTLEFWFNLKGQSGDNAFPRAVSKGNSLTNNGSYSVFIQDDDGLDRIGLRVVSGGANHDTENRALNYGVGEWHHVAASYDSISDTDSCSGALYFDGVEVATTTFAQPCTPDNVENAFSIGGVSGTNDGRYFNGMIDEVRVWSRVLSPDEIAVSADMGFQTLSVDGMPGGGHSPKTIGQAPSVFPEVVFTRKWKVRDNQTDESAFNFNVVTVNPATEITCGNIEIEEEENGALECITPVDPDTLVPGKGVRLAVTRGNPGEETEIEFDFKIRELGVNKEGEIEIEEDDDDHHHDRHHD